MFFNGMVSRKSLEHILLLNTSFFVWNIFCCLTLHSLCMSKLICPSGRLVRGSILWLIILVQSIGISRRIIQRPELKQLWIFAYFLLEYMLANVYFLHTVFLKVHTLRGYELLCCCYVLFMEVILPGVGVTKAPFVNFSVTGKFDLVKV